MTVTICMNVIQSKSNIWSWTSTMFSRPSWHGRFESPNLRHDKTLKLHGRTSNQKWRSLRESWFTSRNDISVKRLVIISLQLLRNQGDWKTYSYNWYQKSTTQKIYSRKRKGRCKLSIIREKRSTEVENRGGKIKIYNRKYRMIVCIYE